MADDDRDEEERNRKKEIQRRKIQAQCKNNTNKYFYIL